MAIGSDRQFQLSVISRQEGRVSDRLFPSKKIDLKLPNFNYSLKMISPSLHYSNVRWHIYKLQELSNS
ncbi:MULTISPECIES: hypothetical protein [Okeania]|uniref:hypothetical protein n=1 Tax=Okeania TaxID=1458928 RepID=UPI000F51F9FC|nr:MULTISPECIES: hypothetical protein [Okeania]NES78405.1 hypothetical protein [Okeania sp. SIO1H4]NES93101.1 hypothetical protein [Okeania sp. SIO2B9]NET21061.1 hypothetical protein [Okeania sp. SIO1H5]NET95092.1 hypothetical protein [Okeania sp. SIO1H2]